MKCKKTNAQNRNGSALALVMLGVVLLVIIGLSIIDLSTHSSVFAVRSAIDIKARTAADAAVADAVFQMNEKLKVRPWTDDSFPAASNVELLNSNATYDYAVSKIDDVYTVVGTGHAINKTRVVNGALDLRSAFDFAVFARDFIELKSKTLITWYNNKSTDWPLQVGVGSINAGAITLRSDSTIKGDVLVGATGDPDVVIGGSKGATITGDAYPMMFNPILPSITPPAVLAAASSLGDIKNTTTISSSGKYKTINLGNSEVITIDEPVTLYITDDITFGNSARIIIGGPTDTDNDASLTIYLTGNMNGDNGAGFNNLTTDAKRLAIYCMDSCKKVTLKNGSDFRGTLYAPEAAIIMDNSGDIYGSIIGSSYIQRNSGVIYYDASLRKRTVNDEGVRFVINRWSEP
ncbi:MAG: collagen-binding domain-containing protein [Planctomycetota bacterium]